MPPTSDGKMMFSQSETHRIRGKRLRKSSSRRSISARAVTKHLGWCMMSASVKSSMSPELTRRGLLHRVALSQPAAGQLGIVNHRDPRIGSRRQSAIAPVRSVEWSLTTMTSSSTSSCCSTDCNAWARSCSSFRAGMITASRALAPGPVVGGDRQRDAPECRQKLDGDDQGDQGGKNAENQPRVGQGTPQRDLSLESRRSISFSASWHNSPSTATVEMRPMIGWNLRSKPIGSDCTCRPGK